MQPLKAYLPKDMTSRTALRLGCLALWAFGAMVLIAVACALFVVRPDPSQWFAKSGSEPACDEPELTLGASQFRIQSIAASPDGSIPFPADSAGTAYRLEGSGSHTLLALSPEPDHLKFAASVKEGDVARVTWADCSSAAYVVRAVEVASLSDAAFLSQPGAGLTVFVQADPSGTGVALRADLVQAFSAPTAALETAGAALPPSAPGETAGVIVPSAAPDETAAVILPPAPTTGVQPGATLSAPGPAPTTQPPASTATLAGPGAPPPSAGEVQAEVSFEGKQVTPATITLDISVYNYGDRAFSIGMGDVHLLPPDQSPVSPSSVEPALPYQIASRATQDFTFTFPNPGGSGIVFQLFSVEFNLDDF